jgi:hypothetical protein
MAGMDYDGIAGVLRVLEAGQQPETFAIEVITFHAAIEHEIEVALRKIIPRPDALFTGSPKLGFAHKAKILNALWQRDGVDADKLAKVLHAFQNLRDAVAHSDRKEIKACNTNLTTAYRAIAKNESDDYSIVEVAHGICLFMADGSTVDELMASFAGLDKLVNETMPRVFGAK